MLGTFFLYNSILIFSTMFVWLSEKAKSSDARLLLLSSAFLIVFIPAAIRFNIGTDYWSYVEIYHNLKDGRESHTETGYQYLNKLVAFLGLNVEWLVFLVSLITCFFVFKSYPRKNAWIINFSFVAIFYLYTYSNFRTGIVLALMLYATMSYLEEKNIVKFFLLLGVSLSFHKTAIVYFIIPFLYSKLFVRLIACRIMVPIFCILLIGLYYFKNEIVSYVIVPVAELMGYSYYVNSWLFFKPTEVSSGLGVVARVLPLLIFILFSLGHTRNNDKLAFGVALSFLYIFLVVLTTTIEIFSRIEKLYYFTFATLGFLALRYFSRLKSLVFVMSTIFVWLVLFNRNIDISRSESCGGLRISPYVSIFNKEDDKSLGVPRTVCEKW